MDEYALVESSREQLEQNSNYIDIWKLKLEPNSQDFTRVTHWGEYRGYKASNPVVSSDGKRMAFQSAQKQGSGRRRLRHLRDGHEIKTRDASRPASNKGVT